MRSAPNGQKEEKDPTFLRTKKRLCVFNLRYGEWKISPLGVAAFNLERAFTTIDPEELL